MEIIQECAAIGDFVWFDANANGIQDDDERGVPDVTVQLLDCQGNVLATTTTDENGLYLFADLLGEPLYLELDTYNNGLLCAPSRDVVEKMYK